MKIYKKILLILFLFLGILFIKNTVFAVTLSEFTYDGVTYNLPELTLQTNTDSYVVGISNDLTIIRVLEPFNSSDYLTLYNNNAVNASWNTSNVISGFSLTSNSLTDCYYYEIFYSNGSWGSWAQGYSGGFFSLAPGSNGFNIIEKNNILLFHSHLGIIEQNIISSGVPLPDGIALTDNILILQKSPNLVDGIYLFYSDDMNTKFKSDGESFSCLTDSGSETYFDIYVYSSSSNSFVFKANSRIFSTGNANVDETIFYSTNDFYKNDTLFYCASGDFFDFYYEGSQDTPVITPPTIEDETLGAIQNQTDAIKEQTDVQKSIFERIGDILSYINPLSENFFAYKLIDLLIDALKSLFVPEERFFRFLF